MLPDNITNRYIKNLKYQIIDCLDYIIEKMFLQLFRENFRHFLEKIMFIYVFSKINVKITDAIELCLEEWYY